MERDIAGSEGNPAPPWHGALIIDCDRCQVRGHACSDCVVTCVLGGPPDPMHLDDDEVHALGALAGLGLVPPLRLVTAVESGQPGLDGLPEAP